jgi:phosphoglycolate phosphatase-like HAD superfamily hydrolase
MNVPCIALDADGVLLDYNRAYAEAWRRAFRELPKERDPNAYWAIDRWQVERLDGEPLARLRSCFDEQFWSTVPALPGAVEACHRLREAGYRLVCVSALDSRFEKARALNLQQLGFPIERVIATGSAAIHRSPKAEALAALQPIAFVDDYLPYMQGLPSGLHAALIHREPNGSPNKGPQLSAVHSEHVDLGEFAAWWLASGRAASLAATSLG